MMASESSALDCPPGPGISDYCPVAGALVTGIDGRLWVYTGGIWGWQRLRWWEYGRRLIMADLEPGEQEARRIYLRIRALERRERRMENSG